jgi:ABC-2 type transport system ATP-binding protein
MKMKFSPALALAHDADLILMDEPTAGLDPIFRREFLMKLSQLIQDEHKAVLFSTHITSDLERTTDFITYIQNGKLLFSTTKDELFEKWAVAKVCSFFLLPFSCWRAYCCHFLYSLPYLSLKKSTGLS